MSESSTSSLERQLGEVVGTMRMTVNAVEGLRESVERLTERAAFKVDLESLRHELTERQERETRERKDEAEKDRKKVSELQKTVWMASGGLAVFVFAANHILPVIRHFLMTG